MELSEAECMCRLLEPTAYIQYLGDDEIHFWYRRGDEQDDMVINFQFIHPKQFDYLLKKGFDLFGLHDNNECLYKNENNEYY
jgi:hypothetical protein